MIEKNSPNRLKYKINVGDAIPSFIVKDHEGFEISEDDVIGSPLVLFFYPKDGSPISIREVCLFRDAIKEMDRYDALVLGVSPDKQELHQNFIKEHHLNFTLLCDDRLEVCRRFDVIREGHKFERSTFVVDADGFVRWIERPVNVEDHIHRVLEAVKQHSRVDDDLKKFIDENKRLREEFVKKWSSRG